MFVVRLSYLLAGLVARRLGAPGSAGAKNSVSGTVHGDVVQAGVVELVRCDHERHCPHCHRDEP
ncbi:hypothetical protein [Actinosynnema sp. NPDC023587]|uniref:hypothetical protein n=1 Tax=Actinosynnema sp. NPDC023587 TaxID=3154695 RepID=UPI0033C8C6A3